jgi:hypothetical protein
MRQALVEARLDKTYLNILESTCLLAFFATPHQSGKFASVGDVAAKIANAALRKPSNDLLQSLKRNSNATNRRFEQFRHIYEMFHFISFVEGESYGKLGIVSKDEKGSLNK